MVDNSHRTDSFGNLLNILTIRFFDYECRQFIVKMCYFCFTTHFSRFRIDLEILSYTQHNFFIIIIKIYSFQWFVYVVPYVLFNSFVYILNFYVYTVYAYVGVYTEYWIYTWLKDYTLCNFRIMTLAQETCACTCYCSLNAHWIETYKKITYEE